jgi:hypothetical protein
MSDPNKHPNFQRTYQNPQSSLRQTGTRTVHIQSSLHPKKVQNNPPQNIKFANREGNIRINDIANLDLNNVIKTNNIMPLEQFAENLIYADINPDDYEDKNLVKLIKAFQYGLEYLYKKQNDLDKQNETLANEYNELINESYDIERRLKENKQKISKYNSEKKERLMLINTYSSIINYHCNPIEEENIVIKQIEKINKENSGARYYCHICSGKPFSSEEKLESHMKRRHNAQARYNINNPMEESFENYERKINEMKEYFENLMKNKENEKIKQNDYKDDLERLKEENNKKFRNMEDELRNTLDNFRKFLQNSQQQQIQIKEQPTTIQNSQIDQFSSLKQSIEKLGSLIQEQNNEKIKEMEKQIEDLKKNQYKYNNSSINKKEDIKINISDNRKKDSFPINSFQKQELKNTQYEAPLVNEIIIKDNIPTIKGDEEKEKEVIIPEINEEEIKSYNDTNPIKVGLYANNKLIKTFTSAPAYHKDAAVFNVYFTNEEVLENIGIKNNFNKYFKQYDNIDDYKIGFSINYYAEEKEIRKTILDPSAMHSMDPYLYIYLYDDIHQPDNSWYSHITKNDNTD